MPSDATLDSGSPLPNHSCINAVVLQAPLLQIVQIRIKEGSGAVAAGQAGMGSHVLPPPRPALQPGRCYC